jgi:beta-lactamase class A
VGKDAHFENIATILRYKYQGGNLLTADCKPILMFEDKLMSINLIEYWGIAIALLLLAGLMIWQWSAILRILDIFSTVASGREWSSQLKTPEDLLEYIVAHAGDVSLVAYEINHSNKGIFHRADDKRPLASTMKILVLAEYARQVELGILSPNNLVNLEDIDIYYLSGTDGDAHPNAIKEFQEKAYINKENQIQLRHITYAMIRYSDNAATDYLIQCLGRDNLENLLLILQIENQDVPLPIIGQFLTWGNQEIGANTLERLQIYQAMSREQYANEVYRLTYKWRNDEDFRTKQIKYTKSAKWLNFKEQKQFTQALFCRGTARGYAQLMERIYRGELISQVATKIMREYLEWSMQLAGEQQQVDVYGVKNGSLPGVITEASYLKLKNAKNVRVFALFFENLPGAVWFEMLQNYIQQDFGYLLLGDDKFFELVRQTLCEVRSEELIVKN